MKKRIENIAPYLILCGIMAGFFSAIVPFKDYFSDVWENRIYFRGILVGFLFVSIGSAVSIKNIFIQSGIISLGVGIFSLLFISTLNLLIDTPKIDFIKTENYFSFTFLVIRVVFIILIFIRLCLNKLLMFMGF